MDCCDLTAANEAPVWSSSTDTGPPAVSSNSSLQNQPYRPLEHQWAAPAAQSMPAAQPVVNQQQQPAAGQFPPYRPLWQTQPPAYQQQQQQPQQNRAPATPAGNWQQQQQQWRQDSPGGCNNYSNSSAGNGYGRGMQSGSPGGRYGIRGSNGFGNNSSSNGWGSGSNGRGRGSNYRSGSPGYNSAGGSGSWGGIRQGSPGRSYDSYNSYNNSRGPSLRPLAGNSGPVCWVKQDCWLLPRDGSTAAAAAAAAGGAVPGVTGTDALDSSSAGSSSSRVVHIMRGLPGAGKSTRAAQLAEAAESAAVAAALDSAAAAAAAAPASAAVVAIHSTDSYFIDAAGVYRFNAELLGLNHQRNYDAFCASLTAGVSTVILDNTNLQPWQFEKYVTAAWQRGYRVREEVVGEFTEAAAAVYAARNTHGVPHDKILMMLDQWRRQ